jgi:hypothetical protein
MTVSEAITNILEEYIASIFIVEAQALRSSRTLVTSVKLEFHNLIFTQSQISYIDIAKLWISGNVIAVFVHAYLRMKRNWAPNNKYLT